MLQKIKVLRTILIAGSVLILVGAALMGWMFSSENDSNVIEVRLKDGKPQEVEFAVFGLVPGESCEYEVILSGKRAKKYDVSFDFEETEGGALKDFVRVSIVSGEEVLYDELLADMFEKEDVVLPVDFNADKNTALKLVYHLPIEIGNEAKNAETLFKLLITASNE